MLWAVMTWPRLADAVSRIGVGAVTTTVSVTLANCSFVSMVRTAATWSTSELLTACANPWARTVMRYSPGGSASNLYNPSLLDTAVKLTPVCVLTTETFAPATKPPDGSEMTPAIWPV